MKEIIEMIEIRPVHMKDKEFWYRLDKHLPESEFDKKVRGNRGYVLLQNGEPVGILRYNLFWDNVPFLYAALYKMGTTKKGIWKKVDAILGKRYETTGLHIPFNFYQRR